MKEFMEAGEQRLNRDTAKDATNQEMPISNEKALSSKLWQLSCP
jgi:hypothetical protein